MTELCTSACIDARRHRTRIDCGEYPETHTLGAVRNDSKIRGDRVKELREALRLTQTELAREAGMSQGTLSRLEGGGTKQPGSGNAERLAAKLRTSTAYLHGLTDDPVRPPDADPVRLERDPEPVFAPEDANSPLERALLAAFDKKRHTFVDVGAVRRVLREGNFAQHPAGDMVEAAGIWFDTAAQLREEGLPVAVREFLWRVTFHRKPQATDRAQGDRIDREAEERQRADAAAKGIEWGSKRAAAEALMKRKPGR
jgi:transcriptional regulator with XRE-family HTH domain